LAKLIANGDTTQKVVRLGHFLRDVKMVIRVLTESLRRSSSSGHLPPGRSKCPMTPLFSILCLFL